MKLEKEIGGILSEQQVDLFGIADITSHESDLTRYGGSLLKGFGSGISIGIRLNDHIVNSLSDRMNVNNASLYYSHAYTIINNRLDMIASLVASFLNRKGCRSLPISATETIDEERCLPTLSHKMIAHLAGLGWIGKNCLLITPEYGPRVRLATVLTDARLKNTGAPLAEKCGYCRECVEICPTQALKGRNYSDGEDRDMRFEHSKCKEYFAKMKKNDKRKPVCGLCLYACPHGGKN